MTERRHPAAGTERARVTEPGVEPGGVDRAARRRSAAVLGSGGPEDRGSCGSWRSRFDRRVFDLPRTDRVPVVCWNRGRRAAPGPAHGRSPGLPNRSRRAPPLGGGDTRGRSARSRRASRRTRISGFGPSPSRPLARRPSGRSRRRSAHGIDGLRAPGSGSSLPSGRRTQSRGSERRGTRIPNGQLRSKRICLTTVLGALADENEATRPGRSVSSSSSWLAAGERARRRTGSGRRRGGAATNAIRRHRAGSLGGRVAAGFSLTSRASLRAVATIRKEPPRAGAPPVREGLRLSDRSMFGTVSFVRRSASTRLGGGRSA